MSIAKKAMRGALWTIGMGVGARAVGAIGTIIITRFIDPSVYGEVMAAWIVCTLGDVFSRFAVDQYLIVKQHDGDDVPFHATFYMFVLGIVGLTIAVLLTDILAPLLNAPNMGQYIPGCILAVAIRRMSYIPDRVLARDMHFRASAVSHALGEVFYVGVALTLAAYGWAGDAIVIGNIVQSCVVMAIMLVATSWRQWLKPYRINWKRTVDMFRFGTLLNLDNALYSLGRTIDNLMISSRFGPGAMALYQMGYNIADIPATQVGEHVSGVLLPSLAKIEPSRRIAVVVRSTTLLGLIIFPMAVGLAVVADPLIEVILPDKWQGVAPLLTILAILSVFRPLSWTLGQHLKVTERTGTMLFCEIIKVGLLLIGLSVLPTPVLAAASVGVAFGAHSLSFAVAISRQDNVPIVRFLPGFVRPLLSCAVMAAAVLGVRYGLIALGVETAAIRLAVEIITGAVVYVPCAFIFTGSTARDFLSLLRKALGRD
ncbi:MAG: oligosaccharide flippase family protein [Proteobacteria bacterium]|nr:oligosaccharide flippase family protein [Pseudomonadota bacterium]